jgi:hypothetical protein
MHTPAAHGPASAPMRSSRMKQKKRLTPWGSCMSSYCKCCRSRCASAFAAACCLSIQPRWSCGVISSSSSAPSRQRFRCLLIRLRIVPASLLKVEDEYLGETTPRPARSEPRRDATPRDKPEPSLPKWHGVEDEQSAPMRRAVA